jgi:queuine tRNA-ribosyltransferase
MNPLRTGLKLPHGQLQFPIYLPDATLGVVRSLDSVDLQQIGIQAVVMNTFHLMQRPGSSTITALGGLHQMCGWSRPIITDSGGFQAYSLIRQNPRFGSISERGITFQPEGSDRKFHLTPEKSIQLQLSYGADIVICLDDCTHVDEAFAAQQESVKRTIDWARRCKDEFQRLLRERGRTSHRPYYGRTKPHASSPSIIGAMAGPPPAEEPANPGHFAAVELDVGAMAGPRPPEEQRPLLFGVIQGGGFPELRKQCAEALLEIGFDGFGFGGWPLDNKGNLLTDIILYTRELVPPELPMHALGVGHPANVVACARMGYDLFDSAMPTRDARHARLYVFTSDERERGAINRAPTNGSEEQWFKYLYVNDDKFIKSDEPVSRYCDCLCCSRYSLGYLHHLFKINDSLFFRLATLHNLRFMIQLTERLRAQYDEQ